LHQSAPDRIMMNTHDLQVSVRNTFVHAHEPEEEDEKAHELARSRSEPSISSSSMNSHSGDSDIGVPLRRPERPDQSCPSANPRAAITHGETSDSGNSSSSGFYDHVAGQEQRQSHLFPRMGQSGLSVPSCITSASADLAHGIGAPARDACKAPVASSATCVIGER